MFPRKPTKHTKKKVIHTIKRVENRVTRYFTPEGEEIKAIHHKSEPLLPRTLSSR